MIRKDVPLKHLNTFGLNYTAESFISLKTEEEAVNEIRSGSFNTGRFLILGGGSNLLFTSDYKGTVVHSGIDGIHVESGNPEYVIVSAGSGVKWDDLVSWTVDHGFGGLENLSLIPGNAGAAPVQNIGAYGTEVRETIETVRAVSMEDCSVREFSNEECRFGYRDSIFKRDLKGIWLITKVCFRLATNPVLNTVYGSLGREVEKAGDPSLRNVRDAVIRIRRSKLPDPEVTGNAGSFFKNPVVERPVAEMLRQRHPDIPLYEDPSGGMKISAGWMIEKCKWKGKRIGAAGVHDKQALVIVNHGNATGKEILNLSELIRRSVFEKFGIDLQREVEVIGEDS